MSRIGQKPILIPNNTIIDLNNNIIKIKGKLGCLSLKIHPLINIINNNNKFLHININQQTKLAKSLHGLFRSLIANIITGVNYYHIKILKIHGIGYKAILKHNTLILHLGYSNPKFFIIPKNINIRLNDKNNEIILSSIDKHLLGTAAATIRAYKKPEPYIGKGIRYSYENIKRKEGKSTNK